MTVNRYLAASAFAAAVCLAQSPRAPTTLHVLEETPLSLHTGVPFLRAIPGKDRFYIQTGDERFDAVDLKGNQHLAIDVKAIPASDGIDPSDLYLADICPAPRGGVIAPLMWNPTPNRLRTGVLRFDQDGGFDELIWLDTKFRATHVAEFSSSGGFIVTGHDDADRVITSLFDSRGKLEVADVLHAAAKTQDNAGNSAQHESANAHAARESGLIQLASGDDDAVYLYNPSLGRSVYRIRPNGQWSEIKLDPPSLPPGEGTMPLVMSASHSSLFLQEAVLDPGQRQEDVTVLKRFLLSVYNQQDGTLEESYLGETSFGAFPVSLAPRDFYFLKWGQLPGGALAISLIHAAP